MNIWQQLAWNVFVTILIAIVTVLATMAGRYLATGIARLDAEAEQKLNAHQAGMVRHLLDLSRTLVQDAVEAAAQTLVLDAKSAGTWSPQLAEQVKGDVLAAVRAKLGPDLTNLASEFKLDLTAILDDMVETSVLQLAWSKPAPVAGAGPAAPAAS